MKESLIDDYNQSMGFVDKNDQVTSQHTIVRKCKKWTTKAAFHLIEEALFNDHILHQQNNPYQKYTDFKMSYVAEVLGDLTDVQRIEKHINDNRPRSQGRHFPELVENTHKTNRRVPRDVYIVTKTVSEKNHGTSV